MQEKTIQSQGGNARRDSLTPEARKEIAKKAADARWVEKATHSGILKIGDSEFPCSVLSDGTRILTQSDFMTGMGMYYSGWVAKNKPEGQSADIPHFLAFKTLEPFIDKHLGNLQSIVVKYQTERGSMAHGIKAEIIPKICEVWMDADEHVKLGGRQKTIAAKAKMIIRALAHVGIVALVDEATGYQDVRNKEALQALLDAFLQKEFATWAKRFPDDFYREIFRLRGWEWNKLSVKRPMLVGKLTNNIVYERLAPGVLTELENRNPKDEKGRRGQKHHQWLSDDLGHPALAQHIHATIAFMRAASNWKQFIEMLDRAFPKKGSVVQLELINESE
jgi:hypothetical protein